MRKIINLPNLLSFSRILFAIATMVSILHFNFGLAILLLAVAGITDFLDGYTARKLNIVSQFGGALDPLADKILMFLTYLASVQIDIIPKGVFAIVIFRDVMILSAVCLCFFKKIKVKMNPLMSSKINTTVQIIYILLVLACNCLQLNISSIMDVFAGVVIATTIWSGVEYVQKYQWIGGIIFKR